MEGGIGKQMWKQQAPGGPGEPRQAPRSLDTSRSLEERSRHLSLTDCIREPLSPEHPMTIGELARRTGVSAKAIRHYESIGLLPRPQRQANGYRRYGMVDVNRLLLLHRIRLLGVSLAEAKPLLVDVSDARCADVRRELLALVDERLAAIDRELAELRTFRGEVEHYQRALVACCPDEKMQFSDCADLECIVSPDEVCPQEERHEVSGIC
jgi:DNA-binding transcriptional MerR regulator